MNKLLAATLLFATSWANAGPVFLAQELLPLPGDVKAGVYALNAIGQVAGWSQAPNGGISAVVWHHGTPVDLSPHDFADVAFIATDINDVGQIVGFGAVCGGSGCLEPTGSPLTGSVSIGGGLGDGPTAWLAPGSQAPLPLPVPCNVDTKGRLISNAGYILTETSLSSPHASTEPRTLCLTSSHSFDFGVVTELYENGIVVTASGFLYDPFVDTATHPSGVEEEIGRRLWVFTEGCAAGQQPVDFTFGLILDDAVRDEIRGLIATGFSRDRDENAAGQFIASLNGRPFLFTPIPEPAPLLLVLIGLVAVWRLRTSQAGRWGLATKRILQLPLALVLLASFHPAHADIIFDWTGTCRPLSCLRAWGEFRLYDSYIPGTEISEPGPFAFPHSPKLKSFVLNFDYGLALTATIVPISEFPVSVIEHFIDTFAIDEPGRFNLLLEGALPRPITPSPFSPRLHLANPEAGDFFFVADYDGGSWGGPFTSKRVSVLTPDGFVPMLFDWPTGTNSVFTLRQAQLPEPTVVVLLLGAAVGMVFCRRPNGLTRCDLLST